MNKEVYVYLFVMAAVTYLIRVLPLTVIRGEIKNKRVRAFLHYVPYVTLAVMTFPAIMESTGSQAAGLAALVAGAALAWFGGSLFQVAVLCCAVVFAECRQSHLYEPPWVYFTASRAKAAFIRSQPSAMLSRLLAKLMRR